jgi:hypothetical protein
MFACLKCFETNCTFFIPKFLSVIKNRDINEVSMTPCHSEADMTSFDEQTGEHIGLP